MKILFDYCHIYNDDWDCKLGLDWYGRGPVIGSKLPGSKLFTIALYLIWWRFDLTWVKDYESYRKRMDYRVSDRWKK